MDTQDLRDHLPRVTMNAINQHIASDVREHKRPQPDLEGRYPNWGTLRWLFLFRLLMVVGLTLAFSPATFHPSTDGSVPELGWNVLVVYALAVLISGLGLSIRRPRQETQVQSAIFVDIIAFTLLMHAAGGVTSGLGILIAVSVAAGALMMGGRPSLFFASLASIGVIAQQSYASFFAEQQATSFTHAGLLGLLFFAVALLSHVLFRRVRSAEELAARRKVDIDDLSKLNDFIIRSIGTGILVADGERHLRLINEAAIDLLNARDIRPGALLSNLSPELGSWLARQVQSSRPTGDLIRIGSREISASVKLLGDYRSSGVIIYLRDNEEAAREAQQIKLASLGTLTASIAHNIRNPLSAVTHASQLMAEDPTLSEDNRHLNDIIRRNSARIEETVQSVLQLSRRGQREPSLIELNDWLETFTAEFRESHRLSDADCRFVASPAPARVKIDPRHLHQILANLGENALIHGRRGEQPAQILMRIEQSSNRRHLAIEVCDEGPGIEETTAREIFNPFFTTRVQGTGLGLYIARELAESNGVRLTHHPVHPHGSRFRLTFPAE